MYQQRILIYMPAPIIGIGLQVQFESWGFEQIEHVMEVKRAMESVARFAPALLVMDADGHNREETFRLIGLVRDIPVIFISNHDGKMLGWEQQLQWLSPYRWLSKPCHIEDLWQAVVSMLPTISSSCQQG